MKVLYTLLLSSCLLAASGCAKAALLAPTGSTVSVSVSTTTVPINGQIEVLASVVEAAGTAPQDGTSVTFTGGLGTFNPVEAKTHGGIARTTFTGTTSGTVKIGAFSGAAKADEVEVKVGAAAAGSISLQVVPPNVGQNGGSVTATALVIDAQGNPLPGVPVLFATDTGTLSNATVISDSNGYAVTNLSTTRQAKITARAGTVTPAEFTVNVSSAPTVTITANTISPVAGSPVAFTVALPPASANTSPIASVVVDFGDGQTQNLGAVTGNVGLTHTYTSAGGYTVSARATDINNGVGQSSTAITVGFPPAPSVTLTASKSNPAVNEVFTVTVTPSVSSSGAPIRSVIVRQNDGTVLYSGSSGTATFPVSFSSSGARTLTATVTDAAGQTGNASIAIIVP